MLTTIDKAIQDFVISAAIILGTVFNFDLSSWEAIIVTLAGALGKAAVTYVWPNKPATPAA